MISNRYKRSTNIRYDFNDRSSTSGIILTNPIKSLLTSIHNALTIDNASKAISIIGPYGTGKSTGLLYALKYFTNSLPFDQQEQLREINSSEFQFGTIQEGNLKPIKKLIPCILVGKRRTISQVLSEQLYEIARKLKLKPRHREPIFILEKILPVISLKNMGLIIVIDELGKFLENAIDDPSQGDVYILQEIAELASRSNGSFLIITSRHQSFESYASSLSMAEINEWKKIQGRFYDIIFQSNAKESLQFICESLAHMQVLISEGLHDYYWSFVNKTNLVPFNNFDNHNIKDSYPLHPAVTALLTPMFKKFAQNERSVFSFIHSNEEFGLKNFISSSMQKSRAYCLSDLFDFININLSYAILNMSSASTWSQIETLILKNPTLDEVQIKIFKTISMLDLFRDILLIPPTIENILFCLRNNHVKLSNKKVLSTLKQLVVNRILTKNETWETYHIWYGGSIDIEAEINKLFNSQFDIDDFAETLNKIVPVPPLLAKEHFARTGSIRYFIHKYVSTNASIPKKVSGIKINSKNPGLIITILYSSNIEKETSKAILNDFFSTQESTLPVILRFYKISQRVIKLFNYYKAVKAVKSVNDQVANDEASYKTILKMLGKAENDLDNELRKIKSTSDTEYWNPLDRKFSQGNNLLFQRLLSNIFDKIYFKSPMIFNEIANRSKPSASGNHGIKKLTSSMLNYNRENLGLSSGAEWGLYLSILKNTGIHQGKMNSFNFTKPEDNNIKYLWSKFDNILKNSYINRFKLIELYNIMDNPPFGIKQGLQPILAIAFLLLHDGEISWYEDNDFVLDVNPSIIEVLLKKPESFSFRFIKSSVLNDEFYKKLINKFKLGGVTPGKITPMDILRPIMMEINRLPAYTKNTSNDLSDKTRKIRNAILQSSEPEELLFKDIPAALGLPHYDKMNDQKRDELVDNFKNRYIELKEAYSVLLLKLRTQIFIEFGVRNSNKSRKELKHKIQKNGIRITDSRLKPFIKRILDETLDDDQWIENVASAVIESPPRFWKDSDVNQFDIELKLIVNRYFLFEKSLNQLEFQNSIDKILFSINESDRKNHFDLNNIKIDKINSLHKKLISNPHFQDLNSEEREYFISQLVNSTLFKTTYE
jgi:hypothetical protein